MRERGISLVVSLLIHALAFIGLIGAPAIRLPRSAESEYKQAIAGKEPKILWYKFQRELPRVSPPRVKEEKLPLQAAVKARQSIVSAPKEGPKRPQMVWTPAPPMLQTPPVESPNVIAVKLPDRPFVAPPKTPQRELPKPALTDAPDVKPNAAPLTAELSKPVLPPKAFVRPPDASKPLAARPEIASDAPQIQLQSPSSPSVPAVRLPPKPWVAPPSAGHAAPPRAATLADAPAVALNSDLNIAVVGLNPIEKATILPAAPSPAEFSAGPKIQPEGAKSEGGANTGLSVPNLFVRGPRVSRPDLIAQANAAPTSPETLRAAIRAGEPSMTVHVDAPADSNSGATRVASAPDPRFNGRDIYMMAIQMPNLTSYSGSWLMWYADRTARAAGLAPVSPPVPHRKVDPKYAPAAVQDRVEGRVQLACVIGKDGQVSTVELVRGADERLNQSAEEALSKWEFYPATRNGAPVDVDVLVEIPFRLAPRVPGR